MYPNKPPTKIWKLIWVTSSRSKIRMSKIITILVKKSVKEPLEVFLNALKNDLAKFEQSRPWRKRPWTQSPKCLLLHKLTFSKLWTILTLLNFMICSFGMEITTWLLNFVMEDACKSFWLGEKIPFLSKCLNPSWNNWYQC